MAVTPYNVYRACIVRSITCTTSYTAQSSKILTILLSTYLKPKCSLGRSYQTKCYGLVTTVGGTNHPLGSEEGPRLTREATPPQTPPRGWFGECIHEDDGVACWC